MVGSVGGSAAAQGAGAGEDSFRRTSDIHPGAGKVRVAQSPEQALKTCRDPDDITDEKKQEIWGDLFGKDEITTLRIKMTAFYSSKTPTSS